MPSSFRDPAGYVVRDGGVYKRVVTRRGADDYETFFTTGLARTLVQRGLVVDHERQAAPAFQPDVHAILVPEQIPFISYPYEWSFDELKDAALLTLEIQEEALARGMSLKDASAFNVQFRGSTPVFIDLSSFERDRGGPWIAYDQFCRHFLGPLLLMRYHDPAANRFLRADLEGFPAGMVSRLLPRWTWFHPDICVNIHIHARAQARNGGARPMQAPKPVKGLKLSVLRSLRSVIENMKAPRSGGVWTDYATNRDHYPEMSLGFKRAMVRSAFVKFQPGLVFDLGAHQGEFSYDAARAGHYCVAFDSDPGCVNQCYLAGKRNRNPSVLPLLMDLRNPSPGVGFNLAERDSLMERPRADLALMLALLHHLRITARVPFRNIADFLARLANDALIEFVPPSDPMAQQLLAGRDDSFEDYSLEGFLHAFEDFFDVSHHGQIPGTLRSLWLARRKSQPDG